MILRWLSHLDLLLNGVEVSLEQIPPYQQKRLKFTGSAFFLQHNPSAQLIERMQQFVDLGVDSFMLRNGGFPDLTTLELLVSEVMSALASSSD